MLPGRPSGRHLGPAGPPRAAKSEKRGPGRRKNYHLGGNFGIGGQLLDFFSGAFPESKILMPNGLPNGGLWGSWSRLSGDFLKCGNRA